MRLIDTHCHLYLEDFDPEQDELAQKAKDSGIVPGNSHHAVI